VAGTCEYGKEPSGIHKMQGISWLVAKTGQLLKKDFVRVPNEKLNFVVQCIKPA
jgi:hypothetical protein